jgi:hypothetical protein
MDMLNELLAETMFREMRESAEYDARIRIATYEPVHVIRPRSIQRWLVRTLRRLVRHEAQARAKRESA